ncbi:uncharacterized protein LOC134275179 [Saccostrea cucullata]|uniref:uncharacterized protein LOC134275179 n=1 Tax=Saccostrea cuccullata TaxID=36930 RepID=UPI002ED36C8D
MFGDAILGFSDIEHIYSNDTSVSFLNFAAWTHLEDMVQILEERLTKIVEILYDNKKLIEKAYNSNEYKPFRDQDLCCRVDSSDLELDLQFNRLVSKSICFMKSDSSLGNNIDKTHSNAFRENSEKSLFLLWQYYGDSLGNYFQYPAKKSTCDGKVWNDPRFQFFRDWFVHTLVPNKKNVVIVLDASGSMSVAVNGMGSSTPTRSAIAREAAMTVLGTLSTTDHMGVVIFNSSAVSSKCSPQQNSQGIHMLVPATTDNMESIQELINSSVPSGNTYYGNAFSKAFQLLSHSKQINPKQFEDSLDMILFLTDGMPEDTPEDILEELALGQALMNHSVHVFVYALGDEIKNTNTPKHFLIQLADQNNLNLNNRFGPQKDLKWPKLSKQQDNDKPAGPVGNVTFIENSDGQKLVKIMGEYYSQFQAVVNGSSVTYSVPQREPNTGLKMTLSMPTLNSSGEFFGVTAIDVHLELTFYEVAHFHLGTDSYAFLVGSSGVVYIHPELAVGGQDLEVYTVDQLEPRLSPAAIYNITNGMEGQEVIKKSVQQVVKTAVCYYKPLSGFSGNFTVVLVIFQDDTRQKTLQNADSKSFPDFLYHRQGFINTSVVGHNGVCERNQALVIPANATIKFAPGSFWDLEKSLMYEQNKSYSDAHSTFKNTTGFSQHAGVTESVAGDVLLMNKIDQHWKIPTDAIWRYMGTENGVFKVFPGTLVPDILYDPREDRWYTAAIGQSHKYMFTAHPDQNMSIVTLAKAFHQTSKLVHGVVAADITVQHLMTFLYNALFRNISHNSAWIVMDDEGSTLMKLDNAGPVQMSAHLTEVLPWVANWLLQKGLIMIDWCSDILSGHSQLSYSLDTSGSVVDPGSSDPCLDFKLIPINRSNLYVVIYKPLSTCHTTQAACSCTEKCSVCDHLQKNICQCPCTCFSNYMDRCTHQINKTDGYKPCPGPHKHWQMQSSDKENKSTNVQPCKPVCTAISRSTECQATKGCNWCSGGHYKNLPLCTEKCVQDQKVLQFKLACGRNKTKSFTVEEKKTIGKQILQTAQKRLKKYSKARANHSNKNCTGGVCLQVETTDETEVPQTWLTELSESVHVIFNDSRGSPRNIVYTTNRTEPTDARVELTLKKVNLTEELETALTLRNYIQKVIHGIVEKKTTSDIAASISGLWPWEDKISFWLERTRNLTPGKFTALKRNLRSLKDTPLDLLGRNVSISSVSVSWHFSSLCPKACSKSNSFSECKESMGCIWDQKYQECTTTPVLPERVQASIYLPCLGLYQPLDSGEEQQVISDLEGAIRNRTRLSHKSLHSFELKKSNTLLGRVMNFTIQGILNQNRVSAIWWDLKNQLEKGHTLVLTIGNHTYHSSTQPTTYEDITNMEINVEFVSLETDDLLQSHPLTARKTINREVVRIAKETVAPLVTKTISNIQFHKNSVKFMVSKKPGDPRDLRKEYSQLRAIIHQGLLNIRLFSVQYTANYTFFVGSFGELCPRQCWEGHDETACSTLSGCYWSDSTQQCSDDMVLPEMKKVTVVFPCAKFEELTIDERNKSLDTIKNEVDKFIQGLPPGAKAQAFTLGDDFRDSFTFLVQGTARRAPLLDVLTNISKWISEGQLQLVVNNTYIRGQDVEDFNSIEIAMLFPNLEFFKLDLPQRRKLKVDLFHHLQSLLSSDFSIRDIQHVWFDQKYIIFKVQRDNLNSSVNKEIERWKQMLKLQAFSISLGHRRIHPTKLVYQKSLGGNCPISCFNRSTDSQCRKSLGCFYNGTWNVDLCQKKKLMGSSYVYPLFVACNTTQTLNVSEKTEAEQDLREKLETLLGEAIEVLQDVVITEDGADIVLHATTLHPHLELYVDTLNTEVDYTKGFRFGPSTKTNKFAPRKKKDSTNVDVILKFSSIDLEALQNLHLATREDISQDLQQQVNTLLVGEVAQTFNLSWIKQDKLSFELKKSLQSKVNMAEEVDKIRESFQPHLD